MDTTTNETIFRAIADHFGWSPTFALAFFREQARCENTEAAFNPLACTQHIEGDSEFNSAGVRNYATINDGISAAIDTLDPTAYGGTDYYPTIRRVLSQGYIADMYRSQLANEMATWGTHDFANEIRSGWNPATVEATPTPVEVTPPANDSVPTSVIDATFEQRLANLENWVKDLNRVILARMQRFSDAAIGNVD